MSLPDAPEPASAPSPARRPRPWLMLGLFAFIVIGGLGWTGAWFYASGRVMAEIDGWMAAEATKGRNWSCADRQFGGFPFRFELICTAPTVTFTDPVGGSARAARAHAVAQVWNPRHIIAEFDGPGVISTPANGGDVIANWTLLQVSGVGRGGELDRLSLAANDYALAQGGTTYFTARHAEMHVRHTPGADAATVDIAAGVKGATGLTAGAGTAPIDGDLEMTATQVPDWRAVMLPVARLEAWQAAGGRVKLLEARLSGGGGSMNATGEIGLDAQRRPIGTINLAMSNAPALMGALSAAGLMPPFMVNLAPALSVVGMPGTLDGAPASTFPFTFRDGRIFLGMLPLGKVGPVY